MSDDRQMIDTGLTVKVRSLGQHYPVWLTTGDAIRGGIFVAKLPGGDTLEADSFNKLYSLAHDYRQVRFNLPFSLPRQNGVAEGAVTGFHIGNGNMLVNWGERGHSQESNYGMANAMPRLTAEQTAELGHLITARNQAEAAVQGYIAAHRFPEGDLVSAARRAQQEALEGASGGN